MGLGWASVSFHSIHFFIFFGSYPLFQSERAQNNKKILTYITPREKKTPMKEIKRGQERERAKSEDGRGKAETCGLLHSKLKRPMA